MSPICGVVLVSGMTREMRETLGGARKWLVRIHERRDDLPKSFLDNCDPKPLADKIHELLSTPATGGEAVSAPDWRSIADGLAGALERLDAIYRSEQDADAPAIHPEWLRSALQRYRNEVAKQLNSESNSKEVKP